MDSSGVHCDQFTSLVGAVPLADGKKMHVCTKIVQCWDVHIHVCHIMLEVRWYSVQAALCKLQGYPHTGREWSAPTTTQPFLPPLTECKKC